ncbi:MAG: hypothetical protein IIA64_04865 [Planctomycetes bacterium]|nr:hypothetical protein [Planctomycetota bacterium]
MPTLLGKQISAATVTRIVNAYNVGRVDDEQLTATQIQTQLRNGVINFVKKVEKSQAIAAADHESDFDLV